ncbi:hypothetical protein DM860_007514 [Cuscuta australis]|uniref:MLO-like protein n=1 Tax=Cuscuta australis TaxID=267555 RepID=A0A328E5L4_9ASTE|nr:hypothetical protein DM860_007514 [Cuscuta australis]
MEGGEEAAPSFEHTPTWVVAVVCSVIIIISLLAERGLHQLGRLFKRKDQGALFEALQKLKDELMLLGFISLLLTVTQGLSKHLCIPHYLSTIMLPCQSPNSASQNHHTHTIIITRLLATTTHTKNLEHCASKGKVPMVSFEALHQLHIFIFVMTLVHVTFCATTTVLGGLRVRQWRHWEHSIQKASQEDQGHHRLHKLHLQSFKERAGKFWRRFAVISWLVAFFKQFYGPVTKSDYVVLRSGFISVIFFVKSFFKCGAHCPTKLDFDFHKYMLRTLEHDFKKIVGISGLLWAFVVLFLLMNIAGWHTYFWMSFFPITLLLIVGTKLEHIITELAQDLAERNGTEAVGIKPSDELFWFKSPKLIFHLIHFILFQNSFEIAFFAWILTNPDEGMDGPQSCKALRGPCPELLLWWHMYPSQKDLLGESNSQPCSTYGFRSCIMETLGFTIPKLVIGYILTSPCLENT